MVNYIFISVKHLNDKNFKLQIPTDFQNRKYINEK